MNEAPGLTIPHNSADVDKTFVEAITPVLLTYSYIFKAGDGVVCNYTIVTGSCKIKQSEVVKRGTPEDISHLPLEGGGHSSLYLERYLIFCMNVSFIILTLLGV